MANNSHTLFYLGAGASVPVLPVTSDILKEANNFINHIEDYKKKLPNRPGITKPELGLLSNSLDDLLKDIRFLKAACEKHISIDTAAKKYLSQERTFEYEKIKQSLTDLFSFVQFTKSVSTRYDAFIAALYDHRRSKLPEQVKVVSWNYDFQFELAFSEYYNRYTYQHVADALNLTPHSNRSPSINSFFLYKMNGSATYFDNLNNEEFAPLFSKLNTDRTIESVIEGIVHYRSRFYKNNIRFAFESDLNFETLNQLRSSIYNCVNLVIIGYSFPFFNREYDNFLLADTIFDNIYIQCPDKSFADISSVVDSFIQHRKPIQPINADDTSPFFIPRNL